MLTKDEVQDKLQIFAFSRGFAKGAIWARDQNAARIAELEAQKEELIAAIMNAYQQIEYLDEKFKKTGTSAAVLSKLNTLIKKYHEVKKVGSK
jgi:serine/threonine protein phosphatase PrpC